jgi:hypothetical protein
MAGLSGHGQVIMKAHSPQGNTEKHLSHAGLLSTLTREYTGLLSGNVPEYATIIAAVSSRDRRTR